MTVKAFAKINLTLDIFKKSGRYHRIRTVFQQIGLHDVITFKKIPGRKITLHCSDPKVPRNKNNAILRAVHLLKKIAPRKTGGLEIFLRKNIPVASGLGGGSSNAAATLTAVNKLWRLNLSPKKLKALAEKIGMDVPFFLSGGTALGTHFGEKITPLPAFRRKPILIVLNGSKKNTKDVYKNISLSKTGGNKAQTVRLMKALQSKKYAGITDLLHNDFDTIPNPRSARLKKILLRSGAVVVHTAGSGPALYALYQNAKKRHQAFRQLKEKVVFQWEGMIMV